MRANIVSWSVVLAAFTVLAFRLRHESWPAHRIAGAAIVLIALMLITVARWQLGRSFSVRPEARQLVTTGLYSKIRNPIYVFAELIFAGAAIFLLSWWPVVIMLALIPLQVRRARSEAAVLQAAFGETYLAYRRHTWF